MNLSIIIPHYELHQMLFSCLTNLYLYSSGAEIIIVDNGSEKPLELENYKIIRSEERLSFAKTCNLGAKEAQSDILLFLNNDCLVLADFEALILKAFENKETVICGTKLLDKDGRIQHVGIKFGKKRLPYHPHLGEEDINEWTGIKEVLAVTGASLAVRKSWFDKVGGFCEEFLGGNYEDVDLCLQARKQKKKVMVALDSKIIHLGGASYQIHPEEHTDLLVRRNWEILNDKWKKEKDSFFGIDENTLLLDREKMWNL